MATERFHIAGEDVTIGRVLSEDKDFMILEVAKHNEVKFTLSEAPGSNRFLSLLFVRHLDDKEQMLEVYKPWNEEEE